MVENLRQTGIQGKRIPRNEKGSEMNPSLRHIVFFSISLLLSLTIVVMSSTVFMVIILLAGSVSQNFFFLYIGVLSINLGISAYSLRRLILSYTSLTKGQDERQIFFVNKQSVNRELSSSKVNLKLEKISLTEAEEEIVDLLVNNGNKMLQSSMVSSLRSSRASISRTITSLENKGIVIKVRKGVTNEIILSETYS